MSNRNVFESFKHAFEGLSHVLWTQKHVRIQLFMVVLVLLLSYTMKLEPIKVLFVLTAILAVFLAELFNTAVEVVVNMITEEYHPLAKIAKDVAAAGVLVASIYAIVVAAVVFLNHETFRAFIDNSSTPANISPLNLLVIVLVGLALLFIIVPLAKIRVGHGTILRGGAVSGHSAVSFLLCAAIIISSKFQPVVSILALTLAILVAQSRVEGKIHTVAEVFRGAVVALVIMALLIALLSLVNILH